MIFKVFLLDSRLEGLAKIRHGVCSQVELARGCAESDANGPGPGEMLSYEGGLGQHGPPDWGHGFIIKIADTNGRTRSPPIHPLGVKL